MCYQSSIALPVFCLSLHFVYKITTIDTGQKNQSIWVELASLAANLLGLYKSTQQNYIYIGLVNLCVLREIINSFNS